MTNAPARLKRLKRVERVRTVARHTATLRAADAEGALGQLQELRDRTQDMAAGYDPVRNCATGAELIQMRSFVEGVSRIASQTGRDVEVAQANADQRQSDLAKAERERSVVKDRIVDCEKALRRLRPDLAGTRRRNWHAS